MIGLAGETPWEHARILMIGQCVEDAFRPLVALMSEKNPEKQVTDYIFLYACLYDTDNLQANVMFLKEVTHVIHMTQVM